MTQSEFLTLCLRYTVHPAIALENPNIQTALAARNPAEVERVLRDEF